mgnify:CR=1 FL=1
MADNENAGGDPANDNNEIVADPNNDEEKQELVSKKSRSNFGPDKDEFE